MNETETNLLMEVRQEILALGADCQCGNINLDRVLEVIDHQLIPTPKSDLMRSIAELHGLPVVDIQTKRVTWAKPIL